MKGSAIHVTSTIVHKAINKKNRKEAGPASISSKMLKISGVVGQNLITKIVKESYITTGVASPKLTATKAWRMPYIETITEV